jgi:hypothetical protein
MVFLQGDPEDRKAVLAHKQWVQEEEERLGKLRQDWVRRRDQKRKAADRKRHIKKQKVRHAGPGWAVGRVSQVWGSGRRL